MKKRIVWLLAMLVALLCVLTVSAGAASTVASGTCGANLTWVLDSDGVLTISGEGAMWDKNYYQAPWDSQKSQIKVVVLSDGVSSIGACAFYDCSLLEEITIPNSVTHIGHHAFALCKRLTKVTLPDSVETVDSYAFHGCTKLKNIRLPKIITEIGSNLFSGCQNLTYITIPDSVVSIGGYAFFNCYSLVDVVIPNSVTSIGDNAFTHCQGLTDIYYNGTEEQWKNISVGTANSYLENADFHFALILNSHIATAQFTIDTSTLDGTDNYAVITVGDKTVQVTQNEWVDGKITYSDIAIKDLTQTVKMGLYDAEGNLLTEQSVSVYDALKARLDAETNTQKKAQYTAQLHYGAAAQQYFGTNTENLANSGIGTMADVSAHRKDDSLLKGKDFSMICGTSMVHEAVPQMKFYFTTDSKTVLVNGEEVELEASAAGYYTYTVDVAPEAFFETITVTVMDGDTVLATITDSVASYCARLHAQGGTLSKTLADALLNYGLACKAAEA